MDGDKGFSDLIGAEAALWTIAWLLAIFVAFFFVGAIAGMIVVFAAIVASGVLIVRAIGRNDQVD